MRLPRLAGSVSSSDVQAGCCMLTQFLLFRGYLSCLLVLPWKRGGQLVPFIWAVPPVTVFLTCDQWTTVRQL